MARENVSRSISEMFDIVIKSLYPSGELTREHVLYIFSRYVERLRALNLQNPLENSLLEDYCRRMMGLVKEGETSSVVAEVLEGIIETPSTVVEVLPLRVDLLEVPCADVIGEVALQVSEVMPTLLSAAV